MASNLVIVESPAKAKTIEKFLGKDFKVASSYGHIADLPTNELGVDVDKDFSPKYIVSSEKKKVVSELKSLVKKMKMVWFILCSSSQSRLSFFPKVKNVIEDAWEAQAAEAWMKLATDRGRVI